MTFGGSAHSPFAGLKRFGPDTRLDGVTASEPTIRSPSNRDPWGALTFGWWRRKRADGAAVSGKSSRMANDPDTITELQAEIALLRQRAHEARFADVAKETRVDKVPLSWRYRSSPTLRYAMAVLFVGLALLTTVMLKDSLRAAYFQTPLFFCAIVFSSWFGGFGPGICSTLLSAFLLSRFFPQPIYNPGFSPTDVPRFVMFVIAGGFISWLGGRQRRDEEALLHARDELEEKVRLRTLALQEANEKLVKEISDRIVVAEERRDAIARSKEALDRIAGAGRATLQRLARDPDLSTFLDHVLAVSVEQFGAIGTSVWLGNPTTGACSQYIGYRRGDGHSTLSPGYEHHFDFADESELEAFRVAQGSIVIHREDDFANLAPYADRLSGLRASGIRTLIRIPLFFGAEAKGILTLKFDSERTLSPEEEGLAHTLADQVVLALELTKLSEKEQAAALATERNRMAADVHDTLAQAFAATLLHLRSMDLAQIPPDLQPHWRFAQDTAKDGLAAARRTMNAMRTSCPTDGRPLAERIAERVRHVAARTRTSTKVKFQLQGETLAAPWTVEDELDRLISEAVFNAERHAAASEINVKLEYLPGAGGLRMRVRDNGRGFDQSIANGAGLGLRAMHDRAERVGATFTLITEVGRGTEIVVLWNNRTNATVLPDDRRLIS